MARDGTMSEQEFQKMGSELLKDMLDAIKTNEHIPDPVADAIVVANSHLAKVPPVQRRQIQLQLAYFFYKWSNEVKNSLGPRKV